MVRSLSLLTTALAVALLSQCLPALAAKPADSLLPDTTKGFLSVPDFKALEAKWNLTQLGEMAQDPVVKPFTEDLRRQLSNKLNNTRVRLHLTLDDLKSIQGGEIAIATIQPESDPSRHALVLMVDITGNLKAANKLLDRVSTDLLKQEATKTSAEVDGAEIDVFELPRKRGETEPARAYYYIHDNLLVATDELATAKGILGRFAGEHDDVLSKVPAYKISMERCQVASAEKPEPKTGAETSEAGDAEDGPITPQARWFVEPFGYIEVARAATGGRKKRGTDILKVLKNQGFTAVQGVGGYIFLSANDRDIVHRTHVYAPPVKQGDVPYDLAANMLHFPNAATLDPADWVPANVSSYFTFQWDMQRAFDYSKTLVDEFAGAPVFDDIMDSLKHDPNGPKIDVPNEFIKYLGQRVSFFSTMRLPITPTSERWMAALEVTNPAIVARTLDKAMQADPDAKKHKILDHTVWEIIEPEEPAEVEALDIAGPGFGDFGEEEEEDDEGPLLPHAALAVVNGHLLVASHIDYMEEVLKYEGMPLAKAKDYARMDQNLAVIGAKLNSFRFFARTSRAYRPTYELVRQGKMPQSETIMGGVLNRFLGPEEKGVLREQQIDGSKMPPFEKVEKYLGPTGMSVTSLNDGWFMTGCLLRIEPDEAAGPLVSKRGPELR